LACGRACGVEARRWQEGEGEPSFLAREGVDRVFRGYMVALLGDVNAYRGRIGVSVARCRVRVVVLGVGVGVLTFD
jgi:hypothetical protein